MILAAIDPVQRDSVSAGVLLDEPGSAVLSYQLDDGLLRRTVADTAGIIDRADVITNHVCMTCVLREDTVPTLLQLAELDRWTSVVLALPVGAELAPVAAAFEHGAYGIAVDNRVRIASTVSVVDPSTLTMDLFGDELLAERGLAVGHDDRRAVGEALARQVEYADVVVTGSSASPSAARLLDQLSAPEASRWTGHALSARRLFSSHHDHARAKRRIDPRFVAGSTSRAHGVWSIDLHSSRPLHPERLMERLADLGLGKFRCRGRFWLPTRPHTVCAWDGVADQVSIGDAGGWDSGHPSTRLIATGVDESAQRLAATFRAVILDDAERHSVSRYVGQPDGFDLWLGATSSVG
jgi:G3E family GTPase